MSTPRIHPQPSRRERRAERRRATSAVANGRDRPVAASQAAWRSPFVLVTGLAVLVMALVIGFLVLSSNRGGSPDTLGLITPPDSGATQYADGEAIGDADAPVVLEVYSDYQCPWCGKFGRENLPKLIREFVATGDLRIEERAIAFLGTTNPDESLDAASAASCAVPDGKYWQFHDYLVWNQSGENEGAYRRERLFAIADRLGLDRDAFATCLDAAETRGAIVTRTQDAFAAGIQSTPTFVLDGERVPSLSSFDELGPLIRAKLETAAGS